MSFGYAVGDVIAVLGLFERIAIELRNYKDAPMHFQQLRAELDLVHSTLKHVLSLEPECKEEHQTLEQIRAIVLHCSAPLQGMVNKMRSKESSLGHFRSSRSLSSIGERLHWSMIAQGDVDSLRKIIMSQMASVNILLSVQQLTRVKRLSLQSRSIGADQSSIIEKHANAIAGHASNILTIATRTQGAVDTLTANAAIRAEIQSKQANSINQSLTGIEKSMLHLTKRNDKASAIAHRQTGLLIHHAKMLFSLMQNVKKMFAFLSKCSKEMLETISKNTRVLLDISGQLKQIMKAIEAIPLHLTLDIVRLDDAHGESWALPLQACKTWESFRDLLRCVVYANERPGADYIMQNLFAVTHAKTGRQVSEDTWAQLAKPGFHIEQAMLVDRVRSLETCTDPTCSGRLVEDVLEYDRRKSCNTCGRLVTTSLAPSRLIALYTEYSSVTASNESSGNSHTTKKKFGPQLPSIKENDRQTSLQTSFRRVKVVYSKEPISDTEEANRRLEANPDDAEANAYLGLIFIRSAQDFNLEELAEDSIHHLEVAILSDDHNAEYWYLLARAHMLRRSYDKAYDCLQETVYIQPKSPSFWISIGILFFNINQYRDSLDAFARSVRLHPYHFEAWYNLGVLYDGCNNQYEDATDAFQRCEDLVPGVPGVRARLEAYQAYLQDSNNELFRQHLIHEMAETPLQRHYETIDQARGENISLTPVNIVRVQENTLNPVEYQDSDDATNSSWSYETSSQGSDLGRL